MESAQPPRVTRWLMMAALAYAFALGIAMRMSLAGLVVLPGLFADLRHAHSHTGYFGVLFPLVWLRWAAAGPWPLPGRWMSVYAGAATIACVGFAITGYALITIIASTMLGALWIMAAWNARALTKHADPWLRVGPVATALSCLWIPPIGVMTPRDPALGAALAHSFLAFLLFLVVLPAALSRIQAGRVPVALWAPLGVGAALYVGVLPHALTGAALAGYGACVAFASLRALGDVLARVGLGMTAVGAAVVGAQLVAFAHEVAMAGIHIAALGAALVALTSGVQPRGSAALWGSGVVMAGALAFSPAFDQLRAGHIVAAAAGALALVSALVLVSSTISADRDAAAPRNP